MAADIYQAVKEAMQNLIAPQIESLKGEIGAVRADIGALRSESKAETAILRAELCRVDEKLTVEIRHVDERLGTEIRRLADERPLPGLTDRPPAPRRRGSRSPRRDRRA